MRWFILLLVLSCGLGGLAQTQLTLNDQAAKEAKQADEKLNLVYKQVLGLYAKNTEFVAKLKKAQRLWVDFRDAQLALVYPERPAGYYGSSMPMCRSLYLTRLTKTRTEELEELLASTEGDICGGVIGDHQGTEAQ